jgi:hypothetical protein
MGLFFDIKCFFGTFISVLKHDGVVEGGTGTLNEQKKAEEEAKAVELPAEAESPVEAEIKAEEKTEEVSE